MRVQTPEGRHPQMYDAEAGTSLRDEGDGGLLWVPAMLAVAEWSDDEALVSRLRESARAAGDAYSQATRDWWICGAPEDIGISPSSEDAGNAVMAYARLHALDGDKKWFELWQIAADYLLSWRKAYNVEFGAATMFKQGDLRTVGGDFASNHNNHLHGYAMNCLMIYDNYLRYSPMIITPRAEDHLRFFLQLLCREPGHWNGQQGMLTEQFYTTDWSVWGDWNPSRAHVQKGTIMGFSHSWCINMVLLGLDEWLGRADQKA